MREVAGPRGITYIHGDLLEAPNYIIAHGCNAQGVMGSGVAKALRDKWPSIFPPYFAACDDAEDVSELLGTFTAVTVGGVMGGRRIANIITQLDYGREPGRRYVSYDAIDTGFRALIQASDPHEEIAIPMIGAGLAQGDWWVIETILHRIACTTPAGFRVFIPDRTQFLNVVGRYD